MTQRAVPLMRAAGLDVVHCGPCAADPDSYVLIRAFASSAERIRQKAEFYGSAAWKDGIEADVMQRIAQYLTVVLPPSAVAGLRSAM